MRTYRSKNDWRKVGRVLKRNAIPAGQVSHNFEHDNIYEESQTRKMKPQKIKIPRFVESEES